MIGYEFTSSLETHQVEQLMCMAKLGAVLTDLGFPLKGIKGLNLPLHGHAGKCIFFKIDSFNLVVTFSD